MTRWIPVAVGIVGLAILATLAVKNLRGPIEAELLHGARSALGQVAGSDSLQVTAEGCDLTLRGVVQDAATRDRARAAVAAVNGVHAVKDAVSVVPRPAPPPPEPKVEEPPPGAVAVTITRNDAGDFTFSGVAPNQAVRNAWIEQARRGAGSHQVVDELTVSNEPDARQMGSAVISALRYLPSLERGRIDAGLDRIAIRGFTDRAGRDEQLRGSLQRLVDQDFVIDVRLSLPGQRLEAPPTPSGAPDATAPPSEVSP
ncbi:MAG: BON domain-containing protein [Deltaproteobacteria bacterium]|nr:BON domain-containing protein [Deltaproteobacteria bacterium]